MSGGDHYFPHEWTRDEHSSSAEYGSVPRSDPSSGRPRKIDPSPFSCIVPIMDTQAVTPRTSGLATAGLVFGCLGFVTGGLAGLIGLILSIIAMVSIGKSAGRLGGKGFAIGGLVTSICSLFLSCVLIGLLLPALGQARFEAKRVMEQFNVQLLGQELDMYAFEHGGRLPDAADWDAVVEERLGSDDMLRTLQDPAIGRAYAMNAAVGGLEPDTVADPANTVLLFECAAGSPPSGGPELLPAEPRYRNGYVVLFVDGSVEFVPPETVDALVWEP